MERPTPTTQAQRPAQRDMMFCHECNDEWYRDEHGLTCPECGSDFTEIIEEEHDPRDSHMFDAEDEDDLFPAVMGVPPHMHPHHNPAQTDDPEETDISNFHLARIGPGRFNVQATITRSISPQELSAATAPGSIGGFMSMLTGLTRAAVQQQQGNAQGQGQGQGRGEGLFTGTGEQGQGQGTEGAQPHTHTERFTYHGGARLTPRTDGPGMRVEPVDDISNVMTGLMAALGASNMPGHTHEGADPNQPGAQTHGQMPPPFLGLLQTMGLIPGGGQMGDFVYSQEGLDRIVSQLMEQTATSNAPGPATQADIDALPRKHVSEDMLGPEHRAECSICMDEVAVGEEVTELPCKHWFHHQCVSAWLAEHDTCPHCRQSISKHEEGEANPASPPGGQASAGAQSTGSRTMPGAFEEDVSGAGTSHDPYMVRSDAGSAEAANNQSGRTDTQAEGGATDQTHRGWFGPQS